MDPHPLWIGGVHRTSLNRAVIINPWDGTPASEICLGTESDMADALERAHAAFEGVTRTAPAHERSGWLEAMACGIESRRDRLARIICAEAGKPITMARGEVDRAVLTFRTAAEEARRIGGEVIPLDWTAATRGRIGITRRFPRGVVGGIVPFNFPLNLAAHKLAPALACGCTVILKPPPQAPGATIQLGEIAHEAGVPAGAVNVLLVDNEVAGRLVDDPRLGVLSFTGSAAVGWELRRRTAARKTVLELGGNAAVIVDGSADLDLAAEKTAVAGFAFAGQVCIKAQRVFVDRTVYDRFRDRLLRAIAEKVTVGSPEREDVLCGPVIDDAAAGRIESWIGEALSAGAKALIGPKREGRLLQPTVLEKVPDTLKVACEEVFGPVVVLSAVDSFEAGLARANRSRYGLQAGVFTRDVNRALKAFETLNVGGVILNDAPNFRIDPMPYGGVKDSGSGREGLKYAIEEFTEARLLVLPAT